MLQRFETSERLSQVVIHGDTVYVSGQVPKTKKGQSVTEQTKEVLANVENWLVKAGSSKSDMIFASVWVSDIKMAPEFNAVWDAWVPAGQAPARACVEAKLVLDEYNVEVAVVAAKSKG